MFKTSFIGSFNLFPVVKIGKDFLNLLVKVRQQISWVQFYGQYVSYTTKRDCNIDCSKITSNSHLPEVYCLPQQVHYSVSQTQVPRRTCADCFISLIWTRWLHVTWQPPAAARVNFVPDDTPLVYIIHVQTNQFTWLTFLTDAMVHYMSLLRWGWAPSPTQRTQRLLEIFFT